MDCAVKYYLIGIGGAGMSAIARVLKSRGYEVSGSDRSENAATFKLRKQGITVNIGHRAENVEEAGCIVYSAAIPADNPELAYAREKGIQTVERSEMLGRLMGAYQVGIAVSGTHGKTTTTAMVDHILHRAGLNPTSLIGSDVRELDGNARCGGSEIFVTEACEAFGSFLHLNPHIAVITNIDADHLDYYGDFEHIEQAFKEFADRVDPNGLIVACADDPHAMSVASASGRKVVSYGAEKRATYAANLVNSDGMHPSYCLSVGAADLGVIRLSVPGEHNVLNSLAAVAVALEFGVSIPIIQNALLDFKGAERRFEIIYDSGGNMIVDDYAHHPTEIKALLMGARSAYNKRIIAVFQPHLYSRTKLLLDGFAEALSLADQVIVTSAYAAREQPKDGVDGDAIVERMRADGYVNAEYVVDRNDLVGVVGDRMDGDTIALFIGAGDINMVSRKLADKLSE